jgi:HEAT repeat protein
MKQSFYLEKLKTFSCWIPYLEQESNLPGPRGNLELAHAVAQVGTQTQFEQLLGYQTAATNTPQEFLFFCGVLGLGKLVAAGDLPQLPRLRGYASDQRWRIREAVATGLQLVGDKDMDLLMREMSQWSSGNWLEKRAAAAALAEPRLLRAAGQASAALDILDAITTSMAKSSDRGEEGFKILRQAMGYCWSVVVAALPNQGKQTMEKWLASEDKDIRWMMRENLKKNRLMKTDPTWTTAWQERLQN